MRSVGSCASTRCWPRALFTRGGRFRVTAQLLDVGSGDILWSDRIDTSTEDIIAVQDEIAQRIVEASDLN